jgi:hypothetical protein
LCEICRILPLKERWRSHLHALKTSAETGLCTFECFRLICRQCFDILGLTVEMERLIGPLRLMVQRVVDVEGFWILATAGHVSNDIRKGVDAGMASTETDRLVEERGRQAAALSAPI